MPDELSRKHVPQWLDEKKRVEGEWAQDNQEIALARFEEEVWEASD